VKYITLFRVGKGRPGHRWADNINMGRIEIDCRDVNWIELVTFLVQWRGIVNTVINFT
jgi:hypothetical protein